MDPEWLPSPGRTPRAFDPHARNASGGGTKDHSAGVAGWELRNCEIESGIERKLRRSKPPGSRRLPVSSADLGRAPDRGRGCEKVQSQKAAALPADPASAQAARPPFATKKGRRR